MSETSARLPENEIGGHPQTGEGAVRKPNIPDDVIAGDPTLAAELEQYLAEPQPPIEVPNADAPIPVSEATPEPLNPAPVTPPAEPPLIPSTPDAPASAQE